MWLMNSKGLFTLENGVTILCAIFSETCLAMVENEALEVAEVGVEAMLHCAIFSATCLAMLLGTKNKKCAHTPLLKLP